MKMNLTATNVILFVAFLTGALVMLYRIFPLDFSNEKVAGAFKWQVAPLAVALVIVVIWLFFVEGWAGEDSGIRRTIATSSVFVPVVLLLFPVMGFAGALIKHYDPVMDAMLKGAFGYPGTLFASFVVPTSNSAAEAVVRYWAEPKLRPVILYFLIGSTLVCWPIFFFRMVGLTPEIGKEMYRVSWLVLFGATPFFWWWSRAVAYGGWRAAITSFF